MENNLSLEQIKKLLVYDPETGLFTRRIAVGRHGRHAKDVACGTKTPRGYIVMSIRRVRVMAHRLAWFYTFGCWPVNDIDHINQIKSDNRIVNLREATRAQNMQNVTSHKHNTSGIKGVCWHSQRKRWRAFIFVDYKQKHLGLFDTKEAAYVARKEAEQKFNFYGALE